MKILAALSFLFLSAVVSAQIPGPGDPEYTTQGRFLVLRVIPKDRGAKLFLAGHEALNLDLKKETKILSVTLLKDERKEVLHFDGQGDTYEILNIPANSFPYELGIKAEVRGKQEELKVKVLNGKP